MPPRKLTIRNHQVEDLFKDIPYKKKVVPYVERQKITEYKQTRDQVIQLSNDGYSNEEIKVMLGL